MTSILVFSLGKTKMMIIYKGDCDYSQSPLIIFVYFLKYKMIKFD